MPAIGTIALRAAAVMANQHEPSIEGAVIAGCVGAAVGAVVGCGGAGRWGSR